MRREKSASLEMRSWPRPFIRGEEGGQGLSLIHIFVTLQIEGKTALVGIIGGIKWVAVLYGRARHSCSGAAAGGAETWFLFDDIGAPVGENTGGAGAGDKIGQIDDRNTIQPVSYTQRDVYKRQAPRPVRIQATRTRWFASLLFSLSR